MNVSSIFQTKTYITIDQNNDLKEEKFNFIFRALRALGFYTNSHLKPVANRALEILSGNVDSLDGKPENLVALALKSAYIAQDRQIVVTNPKNAIFKYNKEHDKYSVIQFDYSLEYHELRQENRTSRSYMLGGDRVTKNLFDLPVAMDKSILFKNLTVS